MIARWEEKQHITDRKLILSSPLIKIISITKRNPRKYVNISNNNNNFDNLSLSW